MRTGLFVVGTRPEAIKLAPVLRAASSQQWEPVLCSTGQHRELLAPIWNYFDLRPHIDLQVMRPGQSLASLQAACLRGLEQVLVQHRPDAVFAVGDTISVTSAGLAAFYARIPFVHVEAGLRTGNLFAPWPEELNRRIATLSAALHCAPTENARLQLLAEEVPADRIVLTGNPVVDALHWTIQKEKPRESHRRAEWNLSPRQRLVLVTAHRRENIGAGIMRICQAIRTLAARHPSVRFVFPLHKNPQVREPIEQHLHNVPNVQLCAALEYADFVWLLSQAALVLTDSGGVQEEAVSLQKRVLVLRETTERPEGVAAGFAELVGTDPGQILFTAEAALKTQAISQNQLTPNPFGDGRAAERILQAATMLLDSSCRAAA